MLNDGVHKRGLTQPEKQNGGMYVDGIAVVRLLRSEGSECCRIRSGGHLKSRVWANVQRTGVRAQWQSSPVQSPLPSPECLQPRVGSHVIEEGTSLGMVGR